MQIEMSKSPVQNLLDLVNLANVATLPVALTEAHVTLGAPQSVAADDVDLNTMVELTAVANSAYTGSVVITYRRLQLTQGVVNPPATFPTNETSTLASVKTQIALALNLQESEFEFTGSLPTAAGETSAIVMTAIAASLLYVGTINLSLSWTADLATAAPENNMSGFDPAA